MIDCIVCNRTRNWNFCPSMFEVMCQVLESHCSCCSVGVYRPIDWSIYLSQCSCIILTNNASCFQISIMLTSYTILSIWHHCPTLHNYITSKQAEAMTPLPSLCQYSIWCILGSCFLGTNIPVHKILEETLQARQASAAGLLIKCCYTNILQFPNILNWKSLVPHRATD